MSQYIYLLNIGIKLIFKMLYIIKEYTDPYLNFIKEDPVRPNISSDQRIGQNKDIFLLKMNQMV
jgi:hypothetical protein